MFDDLTPVLFTWLKCGKDFCEASKIIVRSGFSAQHSTIDREIANSAPALASAPLISLTVLPCVFQYVSQRSARFCYLRYFQINETTAWWIEFTGCNSGAARLETCCNNFNISKVWRYKNVISMWIVLWFSNRDCNLNVYLLYLLNCRCIIPVWHLLQVLIWWLKLDNVQWTSMIHVMAAMLMNTR